MRWDGGFAGDGGFGVRLSRGVVLYSWCEGDGWREGLFVCFFVCVEFPLLATGRVFVHARTSAEATGGFFLV